MQSYGGKEYRIGVFGIIGYDAASNAPIAGVEFTDPLEQAVFDADWRFDLCNNRLVNENRAREEHLMNDNREREEKYSQCITHLEVCIEKLAENQRVLAEEIARIREDIADIKGDLKAAQKEVAGGWKPG